MTSYKVQRHKRNRNQRNNKSDFIKELKTENNSLQKNLDIYRDTKWKRGIPDSLRDRERDRKGKGT